MKNIILPILIVAGLSGCVDDEDHVFANANTQQSFANPVVVGTLPDGRTVSRVVHYAAGKYDKAIYFVESGEVTVNTVVPSGTTNRPEAYAVIPEDVAAKAKAADNIAKAESLIAEAKELLAN